MQNENPWTKDMMWDNFIKREELESSPGVIDENLVRALTLNTYLVHIHEMVMDGTGKHPDYVVEHMGDVMVDIFLSYTYVVEGRRPEPKEISDYFRLPENVEARWNLTTLCCNSDPDNWPETVKQLRELLPDVDLTRIKWDTEERRDNARRWREKLEKDGCVVLNMD